MRLSLHLLFISIFLASCSNKKSTAELADLFTDEFEKLPKVIRQVKDQESAATGIQKISEIKKAIENIIQQVENGEYLTFEQRLIIEKKVRAVNEETTFLLQKLSDKPEIIADLSQALIELGRAVEAASKAMKKD